MTSPAVGSETGLGLGTRWMRVARHLLAAYGTQLLLALAIVALAVTNRDFRQIPNLQNIPLQASFAGIGACGMTLLIIGGAFDLSVAGQLALCAITVAKVLPMAGIVPSIGAALLVGILLGLVNGLVVTKARVPAFIATLGMLYVYLTVALVWTNSQVSVIADPSYRQLGTGKIAGLPIPFLIMIAAYLLCYVILRYVTYGRYVRAVGSNERAARVAGLPVDRVRIFAFALVGFFTAVAGVLLSATLSSANAMMATGYELSVIAVVVIGGTSLTGGRGTLLGSFTGALLFAVISNGLNMFGVGAYWQYVAVGLILITALAIEGLRGRLTGASAAA
jgi:ribose/xylose/arabinose/galactoside ABC-type transport system permease subunit